MKYLRWIGLIPSLLIVGAIGELLAPLPSHALTVKIDGATVQISTTAAACTSGYNLCAFIPPGRYGNWTVGDVSATNRARIMIGDNSTANSLDLLKLTGITFTPVLTTGTKTTTVVVTHTYNAGGGNPQGNYSWGYGMSGYFDPPGPTGLDENVVGNRLKQIGTGNFAGVSVTLGSGIDTGALATPSTKNLSGSISRTSAATVVRPNCNTGSGRCAPAITQTFTITVVGADKLVMTDSVIAAGGTCQDVQQVIPIPPGLYKQMLQLDPKAPNDVNKLSEWLATKGQSLKIKQGLKAQLHRLRKTTGPGTCPEVLARVDEVVDEDVQAELVTAQAAGAVPATSGSTITITKNTNQATSETFTFNISREGSSSTETIAMDDQTSQSFAVAVEPGIAYNITEHSLAGWSLTNSSCDDESPTTAVVVEVGGNVTCTFNNKKFSSDDYRVISSPGLTWDQARTAAQALGPGWDLATITSAEEQQFINGLLPAPATGLYRYWIGGRQVGQFEEPAGNWEWINNEGIFWNNGTTGMFANWAAGEPNNCGDGEHHLIVWSVGLSSWTWNDEACTSVGGYIAEKHSPLP